MIAAAASDKWRSLLLLLLLLLLEGRVVHQDAAGLPLMLMVEFAGTVGFSIHFCCGQI